MTLHEAQTSAQRSAERGEPRIVRYNATTRRFQTTRVPMSCPWPKRGHRKLTESVVENIRELVARGAVTYGGLAQRYGVTNAAIGYAVRGDTWRWVRTVKPVRS